jgi:hypothetical protein
LTKISDLLVGSFLLYRQNWWPIDPKAFTSPVEAVISLAEIAGGAGNLSITTTQNFPATDAEPAHLQCDAGALASFGKYIYFLMKEENQVRPDQSPVSSYATLTHRMVSRRCIHIEQHRGVSVDEVLLPKDQVFGKPRLSYG